MKKMTYFVMALAMVLGFTQCKKEQMPDNNQTEGIRITLDVNGGNSNSRVNVNPTGADDYATVAFEDGDVIYVGYNKKFVGTLTYSGTAFSGSVDIDSYDGIQPLHFYFLGGVGFEPTIDETNNTATVNISNQKEKYPVISYAPSKQSFTGAGSYSAILQNKISIMKFNVDTDSDDAICITGMNNKVTVYFGKYDEEGDGLSGETNTNQGFSYSMDETDDGLIKMPAKDADGVTWAIVLPQNALDEGAYGTAFSEDHSYTGQRPALSAIGSNEYHSESVAMTANNTVIWDETDIDGIQINYYNQQVTIDGISVSASTDGSAEFIYSNIQLYGDGSLVFSAPSGNGFTRIKITTNQWIDCQPDGWATTNVEEWEPPFNQVHYLEWSSDSPASTVTMPAYANISDISQIAFTLGEIAPAPPIPSEGVGSLVYDSENQPIAMVAYVGEDYTLAIKLTDWVVFYDSESDPITEMSWDFANNSLQSYNDFTGETWRLPTEDEWQNMILACGGSHEEWSSDWNCNGLMTMLSQVGGVPMSVNEEYWTGTEQDPDQAKTIRFDEMSDPESTTIVGRFWSQSTNYNYVRVRPVLQIGGTMPVTPDVTWNISYNTVSCNSDNPSYMSNGIEAEITVGYRGDAYLDHTRLKLQSGITYGDPDDTYYPSSLTFTSYSGNITKIVITSSSDIYNYNGEIPSGWSIDGSKLTWEGTPSQSVTMMSSSSNADSFDFYEPRKVEFYLEPDTK